VQEVNVKKALEDIKILDFTRVIAGPFCTMLLNDLGAEVIKVEIPGGGDGVRGLPPLTEGKESGVFIALNWGKKSITLNLASEKGLNICKQLIQRSDVLVENYSPGVMDRLGLSYEECARINPKLVYASLSGFGHTGPDSLEPAFDLVVQARGGFMSLTGFPDSPPTKAGPVIGDVLGGLFAVISILGALHHREKTGEGQSIDISMQDCVWAVSAFNAAPYYFIKNIVPTRTGNAFKGQQPFDIYRAKDDYIVIAVGELRHWENLLKVMGREDLIGDPRYSTGGERDERKNEIDAIVNEWIKTRTVGQALKELKSFRIPCSPCQTFDQVANDPQLVSRGMIAEVEQLVSGKVKLPGSVFKLSKTPGNVDRPAPFLGEHNYEIYSALGYSEQEIKELSDSNII
jgi:CoA:oxalate CoA-transferase